VCHILQRIDVNNQNRAAAEILSRFVATPASIDQ
jgi:hypothetical protein